MIANRLIAMVMGLVFLVLGIMGLFFVAKDVPLLGFLPSNILLELGYTATGLALIYALFYPPILRRTALITGLTYTLLGLLALFMPHLELFDLLPIPGINTVFYLLTGVAMFFVWRPFPAKQLAPQTGG